MEKDAEIYKRDMEQKEEFFKRELQSRDRENETLKNTIDMLQRMMMMGMGYSYS
mgnify:CR=1 FL=1